MKKKQDNRELILFYLLLGIFILLFCNMCKIVFIDLNKYIDSDIALEMKFVRTVVEDGSLITKNWVGGHESLLSRPWFFSIPLYLLTKSIVLSHKITTILAGVLVITSFYFLLKKLGFKKNLILFAFIILISFFNLITDATFYRYYAYSMYIVFINMTLYLYMDLFIEKNTSNKLFKKILLGLIAVYTGIWGVRMFILLYIPLVLKSICNILKSICNNEKVYLLEHKEQINCIINAALNVLGVIIGQIILKGSYVTKPIEIMRIDDIIKNIGIGALSLAEELAIPTGISLKSMGGGVLLSKGVVYFIITVLLISFLNSRKKDEKQNFVLGYFLLSSIVMFIYVIVSIGSPVSRYFILSRYGVTIVICYILKYMDLNAVFINNIKIYPKHILGVFILMAAVLNVQFFDIREFDGNIVRNKIKDYLVENNFTNIISTYWESNVLEGLSDGTLKTGHIDIIEDKFVKREWYVDKKVYSEIEDYNNKTAFILTDYEENVLKDGYVKNMLNLSNKVEIENYNIYNLSSLKIDLNSGLPDEGINTDYPYSSGICINEGSINGKGELEAYGTGEYIMYGPYEKTKTGIYNITLYYDAYNNVNDTIGDFEIVENNSYIISSNRISKNHNKIVLHNVVFENNKDLLEYRIRLDNECKITVSKIELEKIEH